MSNSVRLWNPIFELNWRKPAHFTFFFLSFILLWAVGFLIVLDVILWRFPHLVWNHIFYSTLAFGIFFLVYLVRPSRIQRFAFWIFFVSFLLLWMVLVPGIGKSIQGKAHWISLGFTTLQPIELVKLGWILYLAFLLSRLQRGEESPRKVLKTTGVWLVLILLNLALQPDIDGLVFFVSFTLLMLLISGQFSFRLWMTSLALAFVVMIFLGAGALVLKGVDFSSLGTKRMDDLKIVQVAFAAGFPFGVGMGRNVMSFSISNPHTDFILSILMEEVGVVGGFCVLFLLFFLSFTAWMYGVQEREFFWAMVSGGIAFHLAMQCLINVGVALALLPTAGTPFPFLSWGRTALMVNATEIALLARRMNEERRK
ncbi:MAG: FtsW/RodA/SpoVE family cell cycle protein [bacterium JZ-2024 1]